ncbi:MAG: polyprenyl diphosphate synthase [Gallionella sp.]
MHVGLIIDGNRRWARREGVSHREGHLRGYAHALAMLDACVQRGCEYVSLFLLSKSNIKARSSEELRDLYALLDEEFAPKLAAYAADHGLAVRLAGNLALLPKELQEVFGALTESEATPAPAPAVLLCLGYGGQDEIVRGVQACLRAGLDAGQLDEQTFAHFLDSMTLPPPDLIIRTGGHQRSSGYLLYGAEYAEYHFSAKLWPEFDATDLDQALLSYRASPRNFGR